MILARLESRDVLTLLGCDCDWDLGIGLVLVLVLVLVCSRGSLPANVWLPCQGIDGVDGGAMWFAAAAPQLPMDVGIGCRARC